MARNKINLKMQCMQKLDSLAAFGQRKNDKDEDRSDPHFNSNRSAKIHSFSTMKTYKDSASLICDWMKEHHPEVRKIEDITKEHVKEYVEDRHANGYSNFTLSKHVSCLNKICNNESRDFFKLSEFGNYRRSSDEIVNNRGIKVSNHTDHYERNSSAILMASAFGIRRSSCESATCNQFLRDANNKIYGIEVCEKGGRVRCCPILEQYAEKVQTYVDERISQYGECCRICDDPDSNVNLHAYRAQYASDMLSELEKARNDDRDWYNGMRHVFVNERALERACSHPRYCNEYTRGHRTEDLGLISQALG